MERVERQPCNKPPCSPEPRNMQSGSCPAQSAAREMLRVGEDLWPVKDNKVQGKSPRRNPLQSREFMLLSFVPDLLESIGKVMIVRDWMAFLMECQELSTLCV